MNTSKIQEISAKIEQQKRNIAKYESKIKNLPEALEYGKVVEEIEYSGWHLTLDYIAYIKNKMEEFERVHEDVYVDIDNCYDEYNDEILKVEIRADVKYDEEKTKSELKKLQDAIEEATSKIAQLEIQLKEAFNEV